MSARVYFMKTVNGCKDVFIMSLQDKQWRLTSLLWKKQSFCFQEGSDQFTENSCLYWTNQSCTDDKLWYFLPMVLDFLGCAYCIICQFIQSITLFKHFHYDMRGNIFAKSSKDIVK